MPNFLVLLIVIAGGLYWWYDARKEQWTLFIYPDAPDLRQHRKIDGDFYKFELCAEQARHEITMIRIGDPSKRPAFECGLNCKDDGTGFYICEETRD